MNRKTMIFDFDGTIANTIDAIVNIYNRIAPSYHCKTVNKEDIKKLQAKKPQEILKSYGISNIKLPFLIVHVKKELHREIKNIKPIDGMINALKEIKAAGFNLGIMTSNSKENVNTFMSMNGLNGVFNFVYSGRNIFGKHKVIQRLLTEQNIAISSAVYIGDETRDIEAAKKVGIPVVAVTWGFYAREILATSEPTQIVEDPKDLLECIGKI